MRAYLGVLKWWLSLLISALLLTGCGGGGGSSTSISGTAATGAALTGTVELVDANGVTKSVNIGPGGAFEIDTSDLSAPIMLRATGNGGNAGTVLYSLADGVTGVFNITPLTHLALELLRQGGSVGETADLAATFAAWHSAVNPAGLDALHTALLNAQATINANLQAQFTAHGLTPTSYDFLRTAFSANSSGVDAVLDAIHLTITGNQISLLVGDAPHPFDIHIGHTGYSIGGATGGGSSGGSGGALTCDTNGFQPNSVHLPSAQELADFAGSYTGDVYANGPNPTAGTATLNASGSLTLNGQARTPTSVCLDNVAGPYGTVLYVWFAGGTIDLFSDKTFSAVLDAPAGGGSGGGAGSLTVSVSISGVAGADITINGVPKPASQTEFCSDMTDSNSSTSLNNALGAVGTFTINSCSFNGSVGNVSATLAVTSPIALTVPYTVVYTYN